MSDQPETPAGVTRGWIVIADLSGGLPAAGTIAEAVVLVDEDGTGHLELTSDFTPTTVYDDTTEEPSA